MAHQWCTSCSLVLLVAAWLPACSCPDLAWDGLRVEGVAADGRETTFNGQARITIESVAADGSVTGVLANDRVRGSAMPAIPAGRYRLSGTVNGQSFGTISNLCTAGNRYGCDAEAMRDDQVATVTIRQKSETEYAVELTRNGPCPAH